MGLGSSEMKKIIHVTTIFFALAAAAVDVTGGAARQRWPWNGLVDVDFTVSGAENDGWGGPMFHIDVTAVYNGGKTAYARTFVTEPIATVGVNRVTWNFGADYPETVASNLSVFVTATPFSKAEALYMVIDLSGGPSASSYPVRYTTVPPVIHPGADGTNDPCKTTEMWLRRIPAGTTVQGYGSNGDSNKDGGYLVERPVRMTNDYYMAIFETTQQQWYQVYGEWPSSFSNKEHRATRPVETLYRLAGSYPDNGCIRGNASSSLTWPESSTVESSSFMGKLRAKTGLSTQIDLPTEAQWEHAFRANTSGASYTNSTEYAALGRCGGSTQEARDAAYLWTPDQGGTMYVGSYPPNPWGLYDMFGNVHERCLDGWLGDSAGVEYGKEQIDPPGPGTSSLADPNNRVARGGSWDTTGVNWFLHYKRRNFKYKSASLGFRTVVNCR